MLVGGARNSTFQAGRNGRAIGEIGHRRIGEHRAEIVSIDRVVAQHIITVAATAQEIVAHQTVQAIAFERYVDAIGAANLDQATRSPAGRDGSQR